MATTATFLHVTDTHLSDGATSNQEDLKLAVDDIGPTTKIDALRVTARLLAKRLRLENRKLDGILFTGDAQDRGLPNGHAALRKMLAEELQDLMAEHARFVATPGNHDVPQGSAPGSKERYADFTATWRMEGETDVTPWLDKLDDADIPEAAYDLRRFRAPDKTWEIYPINTCNWSHTQVKLPAGVSAAFVRLEGALDALGQEKSEELKELLNAEIRQPMEKQLLYDIARVSHEQLAALKPIIETGGGARRPPVRIVLMHHHLIAPTLREEVRPFNDIVNISALRTYMKQNDIDIVIHGHKHVEAITYDFIYDHGAPVQTDPRRMLVVSGGAIDGANDESSMRLITITGLPGAPQIEVERIRLGRLGFDLPKGTVFAGRLWRTNEQVPGGPVVIHGSDINDVYARAVQAASEEAHMAMLIVHLDLPPPEADESGKAGDLPFPKSYPDPDGASDNAAPQDRAEWVKDLASWWQLPTSILEPRIPYIHGTRLRRFAGRFDQIKRIVSLLKSSGSTSRAVAVLIDPLRDFGPSGEGENFASFCLVQFRRRPGKDTGNHLDCTAYYRAQEFKHWWPINVAELRRLQMEVADQVGCSPGRITTIAADARAVATRSPGQVAVPVVDRWLDQSPEKLMALACHLCGYGTAADFEDVAEEWRNYLKDQRNGTDPSAFIADGSPVAVDSLDVLASYMQAQSLTMDTHVTGVATRLKALARENRNYEKSPKDRNDFDDWAASARVLCDELLQLSERVAPQKDLTPQQAVPPASDTHMAIPGNG